MLKAALHIHFLSRIEIIFKQAFHLSNMFKEKKSNESETLGTDSSELITLLILYSRVYLLHVFLTML